MLADRVEVSWEESKGRWLVRIQAGDEVIRRFGDAARDADEKSIRSMALKVVEEEGYEPNPAMMTIHR